MSCKCQRCGDKFRVDVVVRNDLWEKIKPPWKPNGGGLLCGRCIMDAVLKRYGRKYGALRIVAVVGLAGQPK